MWDINMDTLIMMSRKITKYLAGFCLWAQLHSDIIPVRGPAAKRFRIVCSYHYVKKKIIVLCLLL